jgi:hypothetical protein
MRKNGYLKRLIPSLKNGIFNKRKKSCKKGRGKQDSSCLICNVAKAFFTSSNPGRIDVVADPSIK